MSLVLKTDALNILPSIRVMVRPVLLLLALAAAPCYALDAVVVKNDGKGTAWVCINGQMQGTVNQIAGIRSDGYNNESGAHQGGWDYSAPGHIFAYYSESNQGKVYHYVDAPLPSGPGEVLVTIFGTEPPTDSETETYSDFGYAETDCSLPSLKARLGSKANFIPSTQVAYKAGSRERFTAAGEVVRDNKTGLQWAQRDNGSDINWYEAGEYCAGLSTAGGAWRLPTGNELLSLYDASGALQTSCGSSTCKVSPLFNLSGFEPWSSEQDDSGRAWVVDLLFGGRESYGGGHSHYDRALCVRRS